MVMLPSGNLSLLGDTGSVRTLQLFAALWVLAAAGAAQSSWTLVWSDEFDGPRRSAPDTSKWTYDLGASGWGNRELENYTDSRENSFQDGEGHLVIQAVKTESGFTSARLKTLGLFPVTYGKVEARLKVPFGQGIWPAFWMLGDTSKARGWPAVGEIDIMENIGKEPATVHATLHGPGYSGGNGIGKPYSLAAGRRFAEDFHTFTVVWEKDSLEFFVDGNSYHRLTPSGLPAGAAWAFDHPFYLILNLAVGGDWPGNPDATTVFPQQMLVDYVRVYRAEP
jgi:beta-glucanase (GH16 family)